MRILEQMMRAYHIETTEDIVNAEREIIQKITLSALYRCGFFNVAAMYGGTCLRIFHGIDRFSEDIDFSLLQQNPNFSLEPYIKQIENEFNGYGLHIEITRKQKTSKTNIESAFLKQNTPIYQLNVKHPKHIKIKIEVDIMPPPGFDTQNKLLIQPFSFFVNSYTLPSLFAEKLHALLFRKWKKRVKGRDWYDFKWYVRNNVTLNLTHFAKRAFQTNHISTDSISKSECIELIKNRINEVDFNMAKNDVINFIKNPEDLSIWSKYYFMQLLNYLVFD